MNQNRFAPHVGVSHSDMDDFALSTMLFDENQEPRMDVFTAAVTTKSADQRRFRATGRSDFFGFTTVSYRRVGGRFGGDVGNRKRREETRFDDNIEHNIRVRLSRRAAQEAIEFGVAEYLESRRAVAVKASTDAARARQENEGEHIAAAICRQSRSGVVVEVVRASKRDLRKKALAGLGKRPQLTSARVRELMGLPAKS